MSEFFYMGGYAFYVWTSYGLAALVLMYNLISARRHENRVLRGIARAVRRRSRTR